MPIQHPTYALPLQSANTIATKQSHDAELNRVVTILVENDRDLNATFDRAIVTGPIVGEWDAGTGAFPTLRPNGDQIRVGDTWRVIGNGTVDGQAFYSGDYLQAITAGGGVTFNGNWARAALGQIEADRIAAETAAAEAQAYAEMAEFTRVTVIASGDGTANPITLPISVDSALRVQVFVNMTRWVPGDDYTVSGYDLSPVSPLVWPEGDRNLLILIDRPFDSMAPTSDDVTHDGQPISQILDRIDAENTFYLQDYLHPDDMVGIVAGDTALQTGSRVTAAINLCLEEALAAMFAVNGASVVVDVEPGIYRINNRLMSDAFNTALWNAPAMSRSRLRFRTSGAVTFRIQNWAPGRASMRTDGIYAGSTHIAPHAVFEWFQRSGFQNFGGMDGQWIIEGANNPAGDPIGWYFYRLNATHITANIECRNLRNRNFVFDSIFNSKFDYAWSANAAGLMLTECGGTGLLPNDTVSGTVRTGLRYTVSGTTLTINTMVYDSAGPSYAYTPYSVFTTDHVGKWIALDRQGVDNLLGDIDDGNEGGSARRSARWFQIASVTDGSTVELTEAPPYQTSTNQWVPQNRTLSFEVLKVSVTAGSTAATLSMPVGQSLVGLEVVIPGAGYDGGPTSLPDLVAMVTAHSGASVTLSHAARISKSGVPFVAAPQAALSSLSHTALAATSRKCDDLHFGRLWCESGAAPTLPLHIHNVTNVTLGDESKLHGSPLNTPNFGANFACVLAGEVGARLAGRFTHSRHSRQFGMFYITGDRAEIKLDGELSSWTADDGSAIWYLDPANVATTRIWDIYYNASDYAYGFPQVAGGQVFERGGVNWTPGRIKAGASQRSPRGERPSWPQAALPAVRSPALGGTRADAVSAVARGWVPDDGVIYTIGGLQYRGQTGATAIPDLPGLVPAAPYSLDQFGGDFDAAVAFVSAQADKRLTVNSAVTYAEAQQASASNVVLRGMGSLSVQSHKQVAGPLAGAYVPPTVAIRANPEISVLVGDSISTYLANHTGRGDMLAVALEGFARRAGAQEFHVRAIGGRTLAQFMAAAPGAGNQPAGVTWWTDGTRSWRDYVADLSPTTIYLSFGMNDQGMIDDSTMLSFKAWADSIGARVVICTNFVPSLASPSPNDTFASQASRDASAGLLRSFAARNGMAVLDFHRAFVAARDGFDIWSSATEADFQAPSRVSATYTAGFSVINPVYRIGINVAAFTGADEVDQTIRIKVGPGANDQVWFSKAGSNLRVRAFLGNPGSGLAYVNVQPITFPASNLNIWVEVKRGIVHIWTGGLDSYFGQYAEPIASFAAWNGGGFFTPSVIEGADFGGITSVRVYRERLIKYAPTLTDGQLYGLDGLNGSDFNHPGNLSAQVIQPVLDAAQVVYDATTASSLPPIGMGQVIDGGRVLLNTSVTYGTGQQQVAKLDDAVQDQIIWTVPYDAWCARLRLRWMEPLVAPTGRGVTGEIWVTQFDTGGAPVDTRIFNGTMILPAATAGTIGTYNLQTVPDVQIKPGDQIRFVRNGAGANDTFNATLHVVDILPLAL